MVDLDPKRWPALAWLLSPEDSKPLWLAAAKHYGLCESGLDDWVELWMRTKTSDLDVTGPLVQHARAELASLIAEAEAGALEDAGRHFDNRPADDDAQASTFVGVATNLFNRAAALRSGTGKGGE
jgi:hypothetical protein